MSAYTRNGIEEELATIIAADVVEDAVAQSFF
jgi:hypothetical protein